MTKVVLNIFWGINAFIISLSLVQHFNFFFCLMMIYAVTIPLLVLNKLSTGFKKLSYQLGQWMSIHLLKLSNGYDTRQLVIMRTGKFYVAFLFDQNVFWVSVSKMKCSLPYTNTFSNIYILFITWASVQRPTLALDNIDLIRISHK